MDTSVSKKPKHSNDVSRILTQKLGNLTINGPLEASSVSTLDQDNISFKIVQAMRNRKTNKEFFDCRVAVDGEIFNCHSFVLQSCSEFFRCRLTPNMKDKDMPLRLNNISTSTFRLILDTLYTGDNPVTAFNIRDMWPAVHQLQIDFLIKLCEDFVLAQLSLDNVTMYKRQADIFHSKRVLTGILQFIIKNVSTLSNTEIFLNLDMEGLKQVVDSDDLVAVSEDIVLQAIYGWVDSNENERKKHLADLLQCTRYCLASKSCIAKLRKHPLSLNDSRVKEIFDMASAFKVDFMRGFWPTAAIHRNCLGFEHVGVYCNIDDIKFVHLSLKQNTVIEFTDIPALRSVKLAVTNGKLFACKGNRSNMEVFTLEKQNWRLVCGFKQKTTPRDKDTFMSMLAQNNCIFIFFKNKMRSFDPNDKDITFQESIYDLANPQHAISFRSQILLFGSGDNYGAEETTVHSWRRETKTWSHLVNLQFTAKDMTSFEDESNWYILDPNGHFWKLTNSDTVVFIYIGKLWDVTLKLKGALLFRETLCLFVDHLESADSLKFKNDLGRGIFQDVKIHNTNVQMSNVVHLVKKKKKKKSSTVS